MTKVYLINIQKSIIPVLAFKLNQMLFHRSSGIHRSFYLSFRQQLYLDFFTASTVCFFFYKYKMHLYKRS